jgi:hypothetical protein
MDYNKCKVLKDANDNPTGQVVTPRAIMIYGSLFEKFMPKGETDPKKAKHQWVGIFHKAADLSPLSAAMNAVVSEKVSPAALKTTKLKKPFHKITEEEQPKIFHALLAAGYNPEDYPVMLRASNGYKPFVANPNTTECLDEEQVYDGRLCRANVNFYFYDHPTGGKGVSASVNSVQLLDQGPVLQRAGGGASTGSEFEAADVAEGASADSVFS